MTSEMAQPMANVTVGMMNTMRHVFFIASSFSERLMSTTVTGISGLSVAIRGSIVESDVFGLSEW